MARGSRFQWMLAFLTAVTVSACTRSVRHTDPPGNQFAEEAGGHDRTAPGTAREDSLEMVRRIMNEKRPIDQEDPFPEELLDRNDEDGLAGGVRSAETPRTAPPRLEAAARKSAKKQAGPISYIGAILQYIKLTAVFGHRSDTNVRFAHPKGFSAGYRSSESGDVGYFRTESRGALETFAVGNLRVVFGEGLLLGRRDPGTTPLCATHRRADFLVTPSLSSWERTDGAGGRVQWGNARFGALLWEREDEADALRRKELWMSASYTGNGWWAGIAAGRSLCPESRREIPGAPLRALAVSLCVRRETAGKGSAPRRRGGFSGEAAFWDDEAFFVLGAGLRGRSTGWVRVFRQPAGGGFGSSANGLSRVDKILQGGALSWKRPAGAARIELSLYDGSIRGFPRSSRYRRGTVYVRGRRRTHPHAWGISATIIERRKTTFVSDPLQTPAVKSRFREARLGVRWDFAAGAGFSHRLRVEMRSLDPGGEAGLVVSSGGRFAFRMGEIVYRFTNYGLPPSACGYVSRPGIGPFEHISFLYGHGSDVSLRVKLWFPSHFEFFGYCGRPWGGRERVYVGMKYPRS